MKTISTFCLLLSSIGIFNGCGYNQTSETPPSLGSSGTIEKLFPLKYGNYWVYHVKQYDTTGITFQDKTVIWETRSSRDTLGHTFYSILSNDFTSEYFYDSGKLLSGFSSHPQLYLQYPMPIGEPIITDIYGFTSLSDTFNSKSELVFDGEGRDIYLDPEKFSTLKYREVATIDHNHIKDTSWVMHSWYSFNTGLIKQETYQYFNQTKYLTGSVELTSYHVN